ncbi:MAG: LPS assembly lipoprotein LptE [Steroidobacteraceae bacterium]
MTVARRMVLAILLAAAAAAAAGCGFHLRGALELPANVRTVYVSASDELSPFVVQLKQELVAAGATLAVVPDGADATVRVTEDRTGRRVLSVNARNTPQEYQVYYVVGYSIDRGQAQAVPTQQLELFRDYSFSESDLLAKNREEDILREAIARDLAVLVVRRLASL